jgi:transcriptional/translational regulatory protein YebC/TACO1
MTTNVVETLPWTDYREFYEAREKFIREEGEARGEAKGIANAQLQIALKAFGNPNRNKKLTTIINTLKELGIPDDIIETARNQLNIKS